VVVSPEDGYGEIEPDMEVEMPLSEFGPEEPVEVGAQFEMEVNDDIALATITAINADSVVVDLNHPLAGETLYFSVSIVDVRDATEEESDHGHVHEAGDHHHH